MALIASDSGNGNFKRVPAGSHIARCYSIIDCGTHTQTGQYGETTSRKVKISWEVFGEDDAGEPLTIDVEGKLMPLTISKNYTLSLGSKANLRKDLAAWRSRDFTEDEAKGFDIQKLLGVYCMLNVTISDTNGKTYSNVAGVSPLHKSMVKPDPVHENITFELENVDLSIFNGFHEKLREYIKQSPEWMAFAKATGGATLDDANRSAQGGNDDLDDDIPF